ncbi:MAG: zinc-ribbon domain-containing protein [Oscillospiraceae bacterium]|nr:zinc-ribbon domain-containing protein [Oscillospiraceae bacterium]
MNCPYCGNVVRENEKFCQSCGAALPQTTAAVQTQTPDYAAEPAFSQPSFTGAQYDSLKDFVQSPACPEKLRKSIKSSWVLLLVCAALTLAFEIITGIFPIDAILLAVFAFWLRGKYSMVPAALALALGIVSIIVGYVQNGTPSGILVALAGGSAVSNLLRAKKLFDEYKTNGTPTL